MLLPIREQAGEKNSKCVVARHNAPADEEARRIAAAVAAGNEKAFRELYDLYQPRLFRLALVLGHGDETLAHEIVQTVFITAASKLSRVESEEHLWNWLARVARQQIGKAWKRGRREAGVVTANEMPEVAPAVPVDDVAQEKLEAALQSMEGDERQVVEWFYFDKLSHKEIGQRLNITAKAVSSRLERARARLRAYIFKEDL